LRQQFNSNHFVDRFQLSNHIQPHLKKERKKRKKKKKKK
jgi:hypothetical protein